MSDNQGGSNSGLFAALTNIASTLLASGKTRLELLGNEIEVEKLRAVRLVLMAQGMVFCFSVGTLLAVALLSVMFWDYRVLVLGLSTGFFLVIGGVFFALFKRLTHRPEQVFAASIAELQEDLRQLKAAVGHESSLD
ncbi:phage holin family protein [Propionivibrio sp.]|uniref:phage holin family protein n=1 Tax=Propionivibrio sp. TaxID=2212460 RepID=UPI003BF1D259